MSEDPLLSVLYIHKAQSGSVSRELQVEGLSPHYREEQPSDIHASPMAGVRALRYTAVNVYHGNWDRDAAVALYAKGLLGGGAEQSSIQFSERQIARDPEKSAAGRQWD